MNGAKCDCGVQIQVMHHIFNECTLTKYENGLGDIHKVTLDEKDWINNRKIQM